MTFTPRPIRIEGDLAYITLSRGHEAVIDAADAHLVDSHSWHSAERHNILYAVRTAQLEGGKQKRFYLHRVIMGDPVGFFVDHINGDGLDNRRANLRLATRSQNQTNSRKRSDNASGYKGVSWHKATAKWRVQIRANGKKCDLGYFDSPEAAAATYAEASAKYHGEFGRVA